MQIVPSKQADFGEDIIGVLGQHPDPDSIGQAAHPTPGVQNRTPGNTWLGQAGSSVLKQTCPKMNKICR